MIYNLFKSGDADMIFFISDTHFGHKNIIKYCNRPYQSVEEMDEDMIERWNRKVSENDTVYILGDFVWNKGSLKYYAERLNGAKVLIIGNHDENWTLVKDHLNFSYFKEVSDYRIERIGERSATLCHYPMVEWRNSRDDDAPEMGYLIHGHIHNNYSDEYRCVMRKRNALNASAEINNFEPVTFEELIRNNMRFKLSILSEEDKAYLLKSYCDDM